VLINGTGSKSQITVTTYTTLANGAFLPNVQNESGNLQQNEQNWILPARLEPGWRSRKPTRGGLTWALSVITA
jgi:hypothetical protein